MVAAVEPETVKQQNEQDVCSHLSAAETRQMQSLQAVVLSLLAHGVHLRRLQTCLGEVAAQLPRLSVPGRCSLLPGVITPGQMSPRLPPVDHAS